jgi:tRNA (guanine-N7-)-methyltransferase
MTGPEQKDDPPGGAPGDAPGGAPWRNFYGRRHGKTLRKGQRDLLETRLAELAPPGVSWAENPERTPIDLKALFPKAREIWLEIGFGGGEHMLDIAASNPDTGIIGCDAYINGVAILLSGIERAGAANLAIHPGDARDLMDVLPDGSVARVFLLYPDPWPKKRHHKRRFISPENLDPLARIMAPGATLRLATDIGDYVRHALQALDRDGRFAWLAEGPMDWREAWPGWPGTRYEAKALREGRTPHYLSFRRL